MGADALHGNGITKKILYFLRDRNLTPANDPLKRVRKSRILIFLTVQLIGFGATFAITQTSGKLRPTDLWPERSSLYAVFQLLSDFPSSSSSSYPFACI